MKTINLIQGTDQWHQHRAKHFNASEAGAMLGLSPYMTRDDLLEQKKSGVAPEVSREQQYMFDCGHQAERNARPIAEEIIGEMLGAPTGFDGKYSCSFDGITLLDTITWEHKLINKTLRAIDSIDDLPEHYKAQMEQGLMISGAEKCLFMASDGTRDDMVYFWYEPDMDLRKRIIDGWNQFEIDLENFTAPERIEQVKPAEVATLPALSVSVDGQITESNILDVKQAVTVFLDGINRDLKTDEDFATAEIVVKRCGEAEQQAKAAKQAAVDQMADVSAAFRAIDAIIEEFRSTRLELDKLVKDEKQRRKGELIMGATDQVMDYAGDLNAELGNKYIMPDTSDLAQAIKGKKSLTSMRAALNDRVAHHKIAMSDERAMIRENLDYLDDLDPELLHLFPDAFELVKKPSSEVLAVTENRILRFRQEQREAQARREQAHDQPDDASPDVPSGENGPIDDESYSDGTKSREIDSQPASDSETGNLSDRDALLAWVERVSLAALSRPVIDDKSMSGYVMTRFNRVMTAMDEIKERWLSDDDD